jgi:hypothetical protein
MKSFLRWIESEEAVGVSEPQHKKGEDRMRLEEIVEKRIKSMVADLMGKGKGSEEEALGAIVSVAQEMMGKESQNKQNPDSQNAQQPQTPQGQMPQTPQTPQGQMPQMPQLPMS